MLGVCVALALACGGLPQQPEVTHQTGSSVRIGDLQVEVGKHRLRGSVKNGPLEHAAPSGAELLVVQLAAENKGDTPAVMAGRLVLEDGAGRRYNTTPGCMFALKDSFSQLEQLNPGLAKSGGLCFEVPKAAGGFRLGIKPSLLEPPEWFSLR